MDRRFFVQALAGLASLAGVSPPPPPEQESTMPPASPTPQDPDQPRFGPGELFLPHAHLHTEAGKITVEGLRYFCWIPVHPVCDDMGRLLYMVPDRKRHELSVERLVCPRQVFEDLCAPAFRGDPDGAAPRKRFSEVYAVLPNRSMEHLQPDLSFRNPLLVTVAGAAETGAMVVTERATFAVWRTPQMAPWVRARWQPAAEPLRSIYRF